MKFDTVSLLCALTLTCACLSTAMLLAWRFLLPLRLLGLWALGIGMYGTGVLLIMLRNQIPDLFSALVANLLVLGCYGLFTAGVARHREKTPNYPLILLIIISFIPIQSWFIWITPDIAIRTALVRICILTLLGGALTALLRNRTKPLSTVERVLLSTILLDSVCRLLVLVIQLSNLSHKQPIQQNMVAAFSSMTTLISMVAWAMAALLLALESATNDLQSALMDREEQNRQNQLNQQRLQALLDISQFTAEDTQQLLDYSLEKVMQITASQFGYIYHYHEDSQEFVLNSWSNGVMPSCSVANPQTLYHLEKTGIWGEAVRQRRPILINDFAADNPLKKGYPEGHVHLSRFLTLPVFDHTGQIVAVVGVANKQRPYTDQDIQQLELMLTEVWRIAKRIELEAKLIRAGKEWQTTFDAISDSVALIDRDQRILRCNQASTRLFGCSYNNIIKRHCYELVHGSSHPIDDCPMLRALNSRSSESQLIFENGRWLHVTVDPLLDEQGEVTGAVHIVHDDTDRVAAEQSRLELLSMLEAVQNELYVFHPETLQFEYINPSAQRNLGYSLQRLLQMTPLDLKTDFNRQEFIQLLAPLMTGEQVLVQFEATHQRADGSRYPVEVNLQLVSADSIKRCLAVIHDITTRRQAEQQMREMQTRLMQQDKLASIGQLSAGIAHEINNPMGFINSNLGTLEKYVDKFDRYIATLEPLVQNCCTEQQQQSAQALRKELKLDYVLRDIRQLLEESADGAGRVMRIVQDLKIFSRSDTAQIARAELHSCIDSTINIIWNQIKYVAELKKEYGDLPKIPCNIQQINQVFMNLLVNACHAIQEKQSDELGTITVRTWADNDNAYIAIADTGCGIPDDVRRRIFEPFYTTKDVGKGTGLGLSISHEIIKKHGGELTVVSEVGTGTTFTIRLPLNQPVAHSTSASAGSQ